MSTHQTTSSRNTYPQPEHTRWLTTPPEDTYTGRCNAWIARNSADSLLRWKTLKTERNTPWTPSPKCTRAGNLAQAHSQTQQRNKLWQATAKPREGKTKKRRSPWPIQSSSTRVLRRELRWGTGMGGRWVCWRARRMTSGRLLGKFLGLRCAILPGMWGEPRWWMWGGVWRWMRVTQIVRLPREIHSPCGNRRCRVIGPLLMSARFVLGRVGSFGERFSMCGVRGRESPASSSSQMWQCDGSPQFGGDSDGLHAASKQESVSGCRRTWFRVCSFQKLNMTFEGLKLS